MTRAVIHFIEQLGYAVSTQPGEMFAVRMENPTERHVVKIDNPTDSDAATGPNVVWQRPWASTLRTGDEPQASYKRRNPMAKHKRMMTGDCGEFYVASLLAGMYSDVKVERMNEKAKDLNVTIGRQSFTIQVKSGRKHTNDARKKIP